MGDILAVALAYQQSGLSVIPIQPREKRPLVLWEQSQLRHATKKEINSWWLEWPDANVGIVTGAVSGLVIIDLDTQEAKEKLKQLVLGFDFTTVPRSRTGKGWQLFFKHPGVTLPNRAGVIPGLDVRGDGGYVVVPPSIHPNGKRYRWEVPISGELPALPVELYRMISSSGHNHGNRFREGFNTAQALAGVPQGQRDETVFRLACKLRNADVPADMAETLLLEAARSCQPPFPEQDALEKVRRVYARYQPQIRSEEPKASNSFSLVDAKDLLAREEPETDWLWDGILPCGGLSLLVAKPKVGKTTLAFCLTLAVTSGTEFLGRDTRQRKVIYLALEEKRSEIRAKLKSLNNTPEGLKFHFGTAPEKAIQEVKALVQDEKPGLLVIDVLQKFCRIKDLNDYAQVTNALEPLMAIAREQDCHILLTHHAGKTDRQDGDDILGSTALLGGVDTLIQIKKREQRRTLFTIQRYGEDTPETVIELRPDGSLEAVGSRQQVDIDESLPAILDAVGEDYLTEKEIWERVEKKHDIVSKGIRLLVERGTLSRTGNGKRGDPYRYGRILSCSPQNTIGNTGRESDTNVKSLKLRPECSPRNLDLNSLKDGSPGRAFLTQEALRIFPGACVIQDRTGSTGRE